MSGSGEGLVRGGEERDEAEVRGPDMEGGKKKRVETLALTVQLVKRSSV